jgi:Uma2 family endonuclease
MDVLGNGLPMSESDYMSLGETSARAELWDGNLLVRPRDTPRHQKALTALASTLQAGRPDLHVLSGVNLRLAPGRIVIPDLVVTGAIDFDEPIIEAAAIRLVAEIISPASASFDQTLKMHGYATAGIRCYLLIDQEGSSQRGHMLVGGGYIERPSVQVEDLLRELS